MTQQFKEILDKVKPEILENPEADLVEDGIIDSLDIMNLVAELEEAYGIDFEVEDIMPENFANAEALWALLQRRKDA